ncbi:MAG: RNA-binding protein [Planctomycetes bacterium]|nr:RNA-binding protein [Planctomycetota bacterium]
MNIYVGNLSYDTTEDGLRVLFEEFGQVESVSIIKDRETGRARGFGFVQMPDSGEGQKAIDEVNGKDLDGRNLKVNEARERSSGGGGRGGGGGRDGGGGGGYGGGGGGGRRW